MKWAAAGLVAVVSMGFGSAVMAADGKAVYEKTCVACHAAGVANAPKLGDKAAWAPRTGGGKAALVASVKTGKGAMPPKAGNAALTDDEIGPALAVVRDHEDVVARVEALERGLGDRPALRDGAHA